MRKLLMAAAIGALAIAVAAPAMAVDFKFGGQWRVQFQSAVNAAPLFTDTDRSNPRQVRFRVRPLITIQDDNGNIQAVWRGEVGDVTFGNGSGGDAGGTNIPAIPQNGAAGTVGRSSGGGIGGDGVNVETKWAYVDASAPFGVPLRVRAGLQPWFMPKSIIADTEATGARAYGQVKPFSYDAFWYRLDEQTTAVDDSYDVYGVKGDVALAPVFNPGLYLLYGRNASATAQAAGWDDTADTYYLGATATGKFGIVAYDLDFIWGSADGGRGGTFPQTVRGWVVDAAVHFPVGPVTVNLAAAYATGDERNGGKSEAFPGGFRPYWNGAGGGFEVIGNGGFDDLLDTQDGPINIWMIGTWITYTPVKPLTLKATWAYAGFPKKSGNCAGAAAGTCYGPAYTALQGEKGIGHELSFRADYTVWTGFKVSGLAGYLLPVEGDTAHEYTLQLTYDF